MEIVTISDKTQVDNVLFAKTPHCWLNMDLSCNTVLLAVL